MRKEYLREVAETHLPPDTPGRRMADNRTGTAISRDFRLSIPIGEWVGHEAQKPRDYFVDKIINTAETAYAEKIAHLEEQRFSGFLRSLILNILDDNWRSHLSALDSLRLSIGLRGMAQKNPKQEYKRESFEMFQRLLESIKSSTAKILYGLTVRAKARKNPRRPASPVKLQYRHDKAPSPTEAPPAAGNDNTAADDAPPTAEEAPKKTAPIRRAEPR